jgi:hypothetical protein
VESHVCLSHGVQVVGVTSWAATRIMEGVGDLVRRTDDGQAQVGYLVARRSRGRVRVQIFWFSLKITGTVCQWFGLKTTETVCQWFDLETTRTVFSGLTSKSVATVFSGVASKPVATVSPGLTSKPVLGFLVEPQKQGGGFFGLGLKTGSSVWCFGPQNHHDGFLVWVSKLSRLRFVGCATKLMGGR